MHTVLGFHCLGPHVVGRLVGNLHRLKDLINHAHEHGLLAPAVMRH